MYLRSLTKSSDSQVIDKNAERGGNRTYSQSSQPRSSWLIAIVPSFTLAAVKRNFLLGSIRNFYLAALH